MPQPTNYDVHYDQLLTNISTAYIQDQARFIATKVAPIVGVDKQSNKYPVYSQNEWFQDDAQIRGDNEESGGSGYTLSNDSYYCDVWAHHKDIGDKTRANADPVYNLDREATEFTTQKMLLRMENQWVDDYFKIGIWGTDLTGGVGFTVFSDYANSDPIGVVTTGSETVEGNTGYQPNTLVLGLQVYNKLKNHPDFVDRIKYTSSDAVTTQLMAKLFEVDNIYIARAIKATNVKGATAAYDWIFGKHALLMYVAPRPGLMTPSAMYTFTWNYAPVSGAVPIARYRMDLRKADRIEAEAAWDNKVVGKPLGYMLLGAVA